jgi:hypothetical protein
LPSWHRLTRPQRRQAEALCRAATTGWCARRRRAEARCPPRSR